MGVDQQSQIIESNKIVQLLTGQNQHLRSENELLKLKVTQLE